MEKKTIAYLADSLFSLNDLENTCRGDEGQLTALLVSLRTGFMDSANGKPATAAVYELQDFPFPPNLHIGKLTFVELKSTDTEAGIKAAQDAAGRRYVFTGKAQIKVQTKTVMVFKPK